MRKIFPPQGSLGDCFVMAGAAAHFAESCDHLYFPILDKANQYEIISCLFKDNPKITVVRYVDPNYSDLNYFIQTLNLEMIPVPVVVALEVDGVTTQPLWDEQNYTLFDIPFSYRYTKFQMPDVEKESDQLYKNTVTNPRYILVSKKYGTGDTQREIDFLSWRHNARLSPIEDLQVIELSEQLSSNMLYYKKLIENAEEIHCVPSSVFCFVDSIASSTKAKLFYHDVRKQTIMRINNPWNDHRWTKITYANKL